MQAKSNATQRLVWRIFTVIALFWLLFQAFIPPKSSSSTVVDFNGGGANWAMGMGFVNATTPENPTTEFKPYSTYPPLYSLLFGLWSKTFGLGEMQNTYFLLVIGLLRNAMLLWLVLAFLSEKLERRWIVVLSVLIAATIPYHSGPDDRAESISAFFFEAGLLCYATLHNDKWRYFAIGLTLGLLAIAMSPGFIIGALLYAAIIYADFYADFKENGAGKWITKLAWIMLGGIIPAIPVALYFLSYPEAFQLFCYSGKPNGRGDEASVGRKFQACI